MIVTNLSCKIRCLRTYEMSVLYGLIPGPKKPSSLNPFLKPLVEDLLELQSDWLRCLIVDPNKQIFVLFSVLRVTFQLEGSYVVYLPWYTVRYPCSRCNWACSVVLITLDLLIEVK